MKFLRPVVQEILTFTISYKKRVVFQNRGVLKGFFNSNETNGQNTLFMSKHNF